MAELASISDDRDPYETGDRVLQALDAGRAKAHEISQARASSLRAAVDRLATDDIARGKSKRGRAGRIARRLHGLVTERHVGRILSDMLFNVSD